MAELMNGVTYLYTIPAEKPWSLVWCVIICAVFAALLIAIPTAIHSEEIELVVMLSLAFSVIGGVVGWRVCILQHETLHPERYAVTVSDTVRMNEFLEKYEIVDLKENAYIIQIKENSNE